MAQETQGVVVNISTENKRIFEIVATLLLCAAVGMTAYALAENGWIEIAASALTMFIFQFVRMLLENGLLVLPKSAAAEGDFEQTRGMLKTAMAEYKQWQARSPMWRLAGLAIGFTIAFMIARWAMSIALTVFGNVWIAGAAAALLGAIIVAPNLIGDMVNKMKSTTVKEQHND